MKSERERLLFEPEEVVINLWAVTNEAAHRLAGRVMIDQNRLPRLDFPFGGREGLGPILSFIPRAKEGFSAEHKSDDVLKGDIKKFLQETLPPNLFNFESELSEAGINLAKKLITEDGRTAVYRTSLMTIITLSLAGSYADANGESQWPYRPSQEGIWRLLGEIEKATEELLLNQDARIPESSTMRALHFFTTSSDILKRAL